MMAYHLLGTNCFYQHLITYHEMPAVLKISKRNFLQIWKFKFAGNCVYYPSSFYLFIFLNITTTIITITIIMIMIKHQWNGHQDYVTGKGLYVFLLLYSLLVHCNSDQVSHHQSYLQHLCGHHRGTRGLIILIILSCRYTNYPIW